MKRTLSALQFRQNKIKKTKLFVSAKITKSFDFKAKSKKIWKSRDVFVSKSGKVSFE